MPKDLDGSPEDVNDATISLERFDRGPVAPDGVEPITIVTTRGDIRTRHFAAARPPPVPTAALVLGDNALEPICRTLAAADVGCLQVEPRQPGDFHECVLDVLAGLALLDEFDVARVAVVGHSHGASAAAQAALLSPDVAACVAVSAMVYDAEDDDAPLRHLGPRCALLLVYGEADDLIPNDDVRRVFDAASEPKDLILQPGMGHDLAADGDLSNRIARWTADALSHAVLGGAGTEDQ